jgi:hypothetical protein
VRLAIVIALAAGCGSEATHDDAAVPCATPRDVPSCAVTCGNSELDVCYMQGPECLVVVSSEACDGAVSCADAGYFGGTASCASDCSAIDDTDCDACAPDIDCATYAAALPAAVAVSGSHVAVGTLSGIDIFDGVRLVKHVGATYARSLVPVPNGWLVIASQPTRIFALDRDGTQGRSSPLDDVDTSITAAGDRAVLAWRVMDDVHVAFADAHGETMVPASSLIPAGITISPGTATDGTSFFVGAAGQLAWIAADGTRAIRGLFPSSLSNDVVTLRWSGTVGWYISWNRRISAFTAQRFTATGTKVGGSVYVDVGDAPLDFLADGDDLLVLRQRATKYEIVRLDAMGATRSVLEIGAGTRDAEHAWLAKLEPSVLAAWYRPGKLQLALAAP